MADQVFDPLRDDDPQTLGGYALRARVGAGGMGQVFLSFTPGGRPVAVKMVRAEFAGDPDFRSRFVQEVRAAQQVNGIHIAQLLDADPAGTTPWLATAYIPGPSLAEAVRLAGPLPVPVVASLTASVARALQAVHAAGIVHRDLKPSNVVLAADGPRVIDFGVARAADATHLTLSGVRVGSPQYTSPEQIHGHPATAATDVFALGAVMYYAATGQPAFGEGSDFTIVFRIAQNEPLLAGCPPELRDLISACLTKDPANRPTLDEVIAACAMPGMPLPPVLIRAIEARQAAVAALASRPTPAVTGRTAAMRPRRPRRRLLAVGAAVLVLAAGALGARIAVGWADDPDAVQPSAQQSPSQQSAPSSTGTPASSGESPVPATTPADQVTPADKVQWKDTIRFRGEGADLDSVPPNVIDASGDWDVNEAAGESMIGSPDDALRVWSGTGEPTRQECRELVRTQGSDTASVDEGDLVCVITSDQRVALLKITGINFSSVLATAKVWALKDRD
ncbi:serine/threonine-protein kinase [Nonomuraea sp. NPDC046570]|uniref:serine/threonine-protein kinase n=1 Tax=Nonomuraea sp. NPDC046570 TaxID=3155255 RepID=UPI0033C4648A